MMVKIIDMGTPEIDQGKPGIAYYMVANREDAEEFIKRERAMCKTMLVDEGASITFEIVGGG